MRSCEAQRLRAGLVDGWLRHSGLDGPLVIPAGVQAGHKVGCSGGGVRGVAGLPGCGVSQGLAAGGVAGGCWLTRTAGSGVGGRWHMLAAEGTVSLLSIGGSTPQRLRAGGVGAGRGDGGLSQRSVCCRVHAALQAASESPAGWCICASTAVARRKALALQLQPAGSAVCWGCSSRAQAENRMAAKAGPDPECQGLQQLNRQCPVSAGGT